MTDQRDNGREAFYRRIEALLNERHVNLVDATTTVVAGLREDLDGLGIGQENLGQQIAALGRSLETAIHDRNEQLDQLRREFDELRGRVATIERTLGVLRSADDMTDAPG